jgi:hypothetical protein
VIKAYLTPQQVSLQLVELHNHRVNAAECAIQTFKNRFIGALGTTDADFLIQLWDKLAPQVQDSINLLQRSRIHPNISAYKTCKGCYDWNWYPMAPPSTKAIIFKDTETCISWAPHGLDTWLLGPSKDHYCCHLYFVPKTSSYPVSGSANLFQQHCIAPPYSHLSHVQELAEELQTTLGKIMNKQQSMQLLCTLAKYLDAFVNNMPQPISTIPQEPQRVPTNLPDIQRVTVTVPTPLANYATALRVLKKKSQTHQQKTRCNTSVSLPLIAWMQFRPPLPLFTEIKPKIPTIPLRPNKSTTTPRQSNHLNQPTLPSMQQARINSQEAINHLVMTKRDRLTPQQQNLEYYAMPVVHPVTGEHITSYHCLMQDPLTSEVWMTAFGNFFGGMT